MAEDVLGVCETAEPSWYDHVGHAPFLEGSARFDRKLGDVVGRINSPGVSER